MAVVPGPFGAAGPARLPAAAAPADATKVVIHGNGPVAWALGLSLAGIGLQAVVARDAAAPQVPAADDVRAYAINGASRALLQRLKVWDAMPADAATPVEAMRIEGDEPGGRGAAAPGRLRFDAWQQCVDALAWIVDAAALEAALRQAASFAPNLSVVASPAVPAAALEVIAEGRDSARRAARGVAFERRPYGHSAVAARLVADRPHAGTARQWFRHPDVLALLPFDRPTNGHSYGLVWSMPEAAAREHAQMTPAAFETAMQQATGGAAGALRLGSARAVWPLAIGRAHPVAGEGWALVGDAAHQMHPLAGQGLNVGFGDVIALTDVLAAREPWRPLGDARLMRRYERERAAPTAAMLGATDALWNLFARDDGMVRWARNTGLSAVDRLAPLKRWLASRAMAS